jgi:hypothetical protein
LNINLRFNSIEIKFNGKEIGCKLGQNEKIETIVLMHKIQLLKLENVIYSFYKCF